MEALFRRAIAVDHASLQRLQVELAAFLAESPLSERARHGVELACEELLLNAIEHGLAGRPGDAHRIEFELSLGERVEIRIRDDLPSFDPTRQPPPARAESLATVRPGGRGIELVRRIARRFAWRPAGSSGNVLEVELHDDEAR